MKLVNQRPGLAQFLCLKNIRLFLTTCSKYFELKETDLFQPSMLYDYSDFAQVLHTLSRLSTSSRALKKCDPGFPVADSSPSHDEEQIYKTLEDLVTEDQYTAFFNKHLGGDTYGSRSKQYFNLASDKEEDIYEDLCSFNSTDRQLEVQLMQPVEKRDYILKELVETERNYVEVLNMLRKNFIKPIASVKEAEKKIIFMNIKELGENHAGLYKDIFDCVTKKSRKRVGEVFIEHKDRFLRYGEYCANLPKAQQMLDHMCAKNEVFREEITQCEKSAKDGKFRLGDLLAVPMQRILKYHLLLRELLQNTHQTHEDYHTVHQAYETMLDVSNYVNEVKRDSEQRQIIKEIHDSISGWNMPPGTELYHYGRLRKDSELKIQSHDTANKKVRYVFIFDKMVLICKQARGDQYVYKDSLKVQDYRIEDVSARRLTVPRGTRWAYNFMLVHKDNLHAYTLFARTEERKREWIEAFSEALDNVQPGLKNQSAHDMEMHTFEQPISCAYCNKLMKGLFFQGYLCKRCNRALHKECIVYLTKCVSSQPPTLPPRPPSIQLPSASLDLQRLSVNSVSSLVTDMDQTNPSLIVDADCNNLTTNNIPMNNIPMPPSLSDLPPLSLFPPSFNDLSPDYVNIKIEEHPWFVGDLDREGANTKLRNYPVGTYLVRTRVQGGEIVGHAISLRTLDDSKHMKINSSGGGHIHINGVGGDGNNMIQQFSLSDSRKFKSIVELVSWFTQNSLKESFSGLDTTLKFAYKDLSLVLASYDFSPDPAETNLLPLKTGDILAIVSKQENGSGWLKAVKGSRIGYIPSDFVTPYKE